MKWSQIIQFLLGSTLGLSILAGATIGIGYLLIQQLSAPPPRPVFDNDFSASPKPAPKQKATPKPVAKPPSPSPTPALEAGAYLAIVSYPEGLAVRDNPSSEAERIGGVDAQQRIVVLETSPDQQWQRIRSESGNLEGWVKAGNTEKVQ